MLKGQSVLADAIALRSQFRMMGGMISSVSGTDVLPRRCRMQAQEGSPLNSGYVAQGSSNRTTSGDLHCSCALRRSLCSWNKVCFVRYVM